MVLNCFKNEIFSLQTTEGTGISAPIAKIFDCSYLKILSPKQMCQRLPVALAQVKAGNTSEILRNEIH